MYGATQMRAAMVVGVLCVACSRTTDPVIPWRPPVDVSWGELPKNEIDALALTRREGAANKLRRFDPSDLVSLRADATRLVAGETAIAAAYDGWMNADGSKPAYLIFGTVHDSRAQIETVASIVFRMKAPWGFALEQFRARGQWKSAPDAPSADDVDLARLTLGAQTFDDDAFWRVSNRQAALDHAAWKFGYVPSVTNLVYAARGASMPLVGCDMPPEFRVGFTGGEAESSLRELHCARAMHTFAIAVSPAHNSGGLTDDDPMPPERFAILVGANHAAPEGLPRFLSSKTRPARLAIVRVLGGRPRDAGGEESVLASRFVVTDPVVVRGKDPESPDVLLLPDDVWGGSVDRASDHDASMAPASPEGLPKHDVIVTSDEPARFSIGDASVDVSPKSEWLSVRAGHQAFILVTASRTMLGAIDVPESGYAEVRFTPAERALRVVIHTPR